MDNLKRYQICHDLITYFTTLIFPKKTYLGLIFRTGGSIIHTHTHKSEQEHGGTTRSISQVRRIIEQEWRKREKKSIYSLTTLLHKLKLRLNQTKLYPFSLVISRAYLRKISLLSFQNCHILNSLIPTPYLIY